MNGAPGMKGQPGIPGLIGPPGPLSGVVFYFRWGSATCPGVLLYLGEIVKARSVATEKEGGYLCLANNPTPSNIRVEKPELATRLVNIYDKEVVPCVACASRRETVIVIPNTPICPPGWTLEYSGILAANPKYPVDNICVDNAEAVKLLKSKSYELAAVAETLGHPKNVYEYKPEPAVACAVCSI